MNSKYAIGQKVMIRSVYDKSTSPIDCTIEPYIGQVGQVMDYYSISPRPGETFYIYTVRFESDNKRIVLHEDEIESLKS